jgi:hypothetical protein
VEIEMETSATYAWAFAVIGGPILLALVLWFGIKHTRRRRTGATAPRSYDQPGEREAVQRQRIDSGPQH